MTKNYYNVSIDYETNCTAITINKWNQLMNKSVKANGKKIRGLIKKHLPELFENLALEFYNPYEQQSKRTKTHFIYVHSGIEYFLNIN